MFQKTAELILTKNELELTMINIILQTAYLIISLYRMKKLRSRTFSISSSGDPPVR